MDQVGDSRCTIQVCHRNATGSIALKKRVSSVILNVYQNTGIEKNDDSRHSLENHAKIDEIRRLTNKSFDSSHDVHRALALAEGYSKNMKRGEYQYVSGIMGMSNSPFLSADARAAYTNFEVTELLKFWTEKIIKIDSMEREKPNLGLLFEKGPEVICYTTFTLDPKENNKKKQVELGLGKQRLKYEANPIFLGLTTSPSHRQLTFSAHTKDVKQRMTARRKALTAIAGRSTGTSQNNLRSAYIATTTPQESGLARPTPRHGTPLRNSTTSVPESSLAASESRESRPCSPALIFRR